MNAPLRPSFACFASVLFRSSIRFSGCLIGALIIFLCMGTQQAFALSQATTTSLAITSVGNTVSTIAPKTVVTLTATVASGSGSVTLGTVNFCDATALSCTDIHLVGTAQITGSGVATVRFRPAIGSHSYKAVFAGTRSYAASVSAASSLVVPGTTTTNLSVSGGAGSYTLTGSVTASGAASPLSALSFQDVSNGNYVLGTQSLVLAGSTLSFSNSGTNSTGGGSFSVPAPAVGDFNLDGIPDLAVPNASGSVQVLLGKGDGTFTTGASYPAGSAPIAAVVADFNSDGKPDIAIANENSNTVTILLGNGDGTFNATSFMPATGSQPRGITAGDFNHDGTIDLAVTNSSDNAITVLLGNGDGTFTAASPVPTPNSPLGIISGDFNGDGTLDLAISNTYYSAGCAHVFLGNGDGTFTLGPSFTSSATSSCYALAAADVNSDGKLDLLVADFDNYRVYTYLGDGTGNFPSKTTTAQSDNHYSPVSLAVGDFNGDGLVDFATTSSIVNTLSVGIGFGGGIFVFNNTSAASTGSNPTSVTVADFNGDGLSDAALENGGATLTTFNSSVSQSFQATLANVSPVGTGAHQVQAVYPGDSAYSSNVSNVVSLTAQPVVTALGLIANPSSASLYGQQVVLTATLTPFSAQGHASDGELVTFYNGGVAIGSSALARGVASITLTSLPAGTNSLNAVYSSDGNFSSSTSGTVAYKVTYPATLGLVANLTSVTYGQQVTLTATLSSATQVQSTNGESIIFKNGATILGSAPLASGVATFALPLLPVSTPNLTASYAGDTYFAPATSGNVPFTIAQATPVVTWSPPTTSFVYTGAAIGSMLFNASSATPGTIAYTAAAASGLPIPINPSSVFSAGSYILTATLTPTDKTDYTAASSTVAFTVSPATLTVVPQNATRVYGTANPTFTGTVAGALNSDTFTVNGATTASTTSAISSYPITYTVAGSNLANYSVVQAAGVLTITASVPTITWAAPAAITYGTTLSTSQLNAASSAPGALTYTPSPGTVLAAGSYTLSVTFTPTDTTNYTSKTALVSLIVNKAALTIAANSFSRVYGTANPAFMGTVSGAVAGDTFTESFSTTATLGSIVGNYPIVPSVSGANLSNYTVAATSGSLAVSQAGTATTFALSNSNLTLTAMISALNSGMPTGTVAFYEGQTLVGTGTIVNGLASYTAASFPSGDVVVTAEYSGDANFTQSASPPILVLTVTPAQTQLSVATSGSATDSLSLAAATGFTGTIQFSCIGLPKYATCSFSPSSVTFGNSASASTTLTIQTGVSASLIRSNLFPQRNVTALATLFCLPGLCLLPFARRRLPKLLSGTLLMLLIAAACTSVTACAGSPQSPAAASSTQTPAGSSAVQVISTGPGGLSQTINLNVTVQ